MDSAQVAINIFAVYDYTVNHFGDNFYVQEMNWLVMLKFFSSENSAMSSSELNSAE
jgi:hypothetical protein